MRRWRTVQLPTVSDPRGKITFIESQRHVPFQIRRAYWIYDVPGGELRGGHAYRTQEEVIISLSGSFDVVLEDGAGIERVPLNRSFYGLYVPSMTWRQIENFSTNGVCLILASKAYRPEDYIRDREAFLATAGRT